MLLDVSRALRLPGEVFPFLHREEIPPQEIFGETITFSDAVLTGHFSMAGDSLHLEGTLTVTAHILRRKMPIKTRMNAWCLRARKWSFRSWR